MLLPKPVQDVGRVKACVVAQLPRDHLEGFSVAVDDELGLAVDLARVHAQELGQLHLDRSPARHNLGVLDGAADDHDGVVDRALRLRDELLRSSTQHNRRGLALRTLGEDVEALVPDLLLLEETARADDLGHEVLDRGLHAGAARTHHPLHVVVGHAPRAEDVAVCEVLRRQVADREAREHDLAASGDDFVELLVDDVPLRVDDALVLFGVVEADFGVLLLRFELELDVEEADFGVGEPFRLLLETGVRKRLLERDSVHKERILESSSRHFLDADHLEAHVRVKR
mmetsp:Transcript_42853/g.100760  ORF Transcript_42853/g.100760 Transcript_42853/m.100760 type:complete len:285 (-) Transcript_42853:651-1505(-)